MWCQQVDIVLAIPGGWYLQTFNASGPAVPPPPAPPQPSPRVFPWSNKSLTPDKRTALLLAEMTLDEKAAQLGYGEGPTDPQQLLDANPNGVGGKTVHLPCVCLV